MNATQCNFCDRQMTPRHNKRYCSDKCRTAASSAERRAQRRDITQPFTCAQCGSRINRHAQSGRFPRYCSRECIVRRDRERRQALRASHVIHCGQCGVALPPTRKAHSKFCGSRCAYVAKAQRNGIKPVAPAVDRFWSRVAMDDVTQCWNWIGAMLVSGYGSLRVNNRAQVVHRFAWELLRGPIPDGLQVDHLCRNRRCCNPDHLEPVTQQENLRRARAAALLSGVRPEAAA